MARPVNYDIARAILHEMFAAAEQDVSAGSSPPVPPEVARATDKLIGSSTQAYREVLVGCCLARLSDARIDLRLPYANLGDTAYNGRSLDESVVNPFLHQQQIPASRGPFLSVFRRSVPFTGDTRGGLRDKVGFDALLDFIDALGTAGAETARTYLRFLLAAFVRLRNASNIALARVERLSLEQYDLLAGRLLQVPSGGRFPVLLTVAMCRTIKTAFGLDWEIEIQGINVADRASNVGADVTIRAARDIILSIEVTERPIDRARVEATFNTKILMHGLTDYVFFHGDAPPSEDARALARRYFGQGHDISFMPVKDWLTNSLLTVGSRYRPEFMAQTRDLLRDKDIPAALKLAWNDIIKALVDP